MLWLCVVLMVQAGKEPQFSPTDPYQTAWWMAHLYLPVRVAEGGGNDTARDLALRKFRQQLATVKGKRVRWSMAVVTVSHQRILCELAERPDEKRPPFSIGHIRVTPALEKFAASLRPGMEVIVSGNIAGFHGNAEVELTNITLQRPKEKK